MGVSIQDSLKMIKFREWENTLGQMEQFTMVNGRKIKCMDRVYQSDKMEEDIWDNLSMIKKKVEGYKNGMMGEFMMESGRMANNIKKAHIQQR